jgi:hypothetical protein
MIFSPHLSVGATEDLNAVSSNLGQVNSGRAISMDLEKVLVQLREERARLDSAISSLERLDRLRNLGSDGLSTLAAKSHTNGANGDCRPARPAHEE